MDEPQRSPDETSAEVVQDFKAFLEDALRTYYFARFGLMREAAALMELPPPPLENPDPMIHIGDSRPGEPWEAQTRLRVSEAQALLERGGMIERRLGQQFVVFVFAGWEHLYRRRLASAHGCEIEDVQVPVMGDLRHFRNDVIHHRGVASRDNSGRCEILGHWVTVGEEISIGPDELREPWTTFPWSELEGHPHVDP